MVNMRITPLNRKLLRDLLAMKGQALAIAMVVAAGVAMFVMYLSNFGYGSGGPSLYHLEQNNRSWFVDLKKNRRVYRDTDKDDTRIFRRAVTRVAFVGEPHLPIRFVESVYNRFIPGEKRNSAD